jgi:hypothetical protein
MSVRKTHTCPSCDSELNIVTIRKHTVFRRGFKRGFCGVCDWSGMIEGERDREIVMGLYDDELDIIQYNFSHNNNFIDFLINFNEELEREMLEMPDDTGDSEQEA